MLLFYGVNCKLYIASENQLSIEVLLQNTTELWSGPWKRSTTDTWDGSARGRLQENLVENNQTFVTQAYHRLTEVLDGGGDVA